MTYFFYFFTYYCNRFSFYSVVFYSFQSFLEETPQNLYHFPCIKPFVLATRQTFEFHFHYFCVFYSVFLYSSVIKFHSWMKSVSFQWFFRRTLFLYFTCKLCSTYYFTYKHFALLALLALPEIICLVIAHCCS